ncbi:hypothetical protein N408_01115 [Helicobacter pylori FD703]|nr:hypothetical protein N408_01115 [Helicobacter pylori FD703]
MLWLLITIIVFLYYRGIREYDKTKGYLKDTILQSQDNFNEMVSYFFF